jgi:hypothetical protein
MRIHHIAAAVVVSLSCAVLTASCVQSPQADVEQASPAASGEATAEAPAPLTDPACAEACDHAYEARNARCRKMNNAALRQTCWITSNMAYALCLKLCPDLTPCPPD